MPSDWVFVSAACVAECPITKITCPNETEHRTLLAANNGAFNEKSEADLRLRELNSSFCSDLNMSLSDVVGRREPAFQELQEAMVLTESQSLSEARWLHPAPCSVLEPS